MSIALTGAEIVLIRSTCSMPVPGHVRDAQEPDSVVEYQLDRFGADAHTLQGDNERIITYHE